MIYDIAIIGGGAAGLTAAIYARRGSKNVAVFEALACGGQILNSARIDNFPVAPHISGADFGKTLAAQAEELGAEIIYDKILKVTGALNDFTLVSEDSEYKAKTIILACGTTNQKLGIEREDELVGKGVSYCATCDGNFFKDKDVAVFGGGNSALHESLYLSDICKTVYLIHRRNEFRAADNLVEKIQQRDNVKTVLGANVVKLNGDKKLESISTDQGEEIPVDALFVSIGRVPAADDMIDGLSLNSDGFVEAADNCKTNIEGVFVAGDLRTKQLRQLITAASDGAIAASAAIDALKVNS